MTETIELNNKKSIQFYQNILNHLGFKINSDSKILDFGCGEGEAVYIYRKMGFRAFGVDIEPRYSNNQNLCEAEKLLKEDKNIFRKIDTSPYKILFEDETFDFVFSDQVFEHVQNYSEALSEIHRILKPSGFSLHIFPSKYKPIESHVFVPFAGIVQKYNYLLFWAFLGIRNQFQKGLNFKKVAKLNFNYLRDCTNYLSKAEIKKNILVYFDNIYFAERLYMKYCSGNIRHISFLAQLPFISSLSSSLVSTFHTKVIFFKKN